MSEPHNLAVGSDHAIYRIRFRRLGSRFTDRNGIDAWVMSDGVATGTVRHIDDNSGFFPFSFQVAPEDVQRMLNAWNSIESECCEPDFNVGVGKLLAPLQVKGIPNLGKSTEGDGSWEIWNLLESICQRAIKSVASDKRQGDFPTT